MSWRIGQFFLFLGLLALFVFFVSLQTQQASLMYCLSGILLTGLGGFMLWRGRVPRTPSDTRFQSVRRIRSRGKKGK